MARLPFLEATPTLENSPNTLSALSHIFVDTSADSHHFEEGSTSAHTLLLPLWAYFMRISMHITDFSPGMHIPPWRARPGMHIPVLAVMVVCLWCLLSPATKELLPVLLHSLCALCSLLGATGVLEPQHAHAGLATRCCARIVPVHTRWYSRHRDGCFSVVVRGHSCAK